MRVGLMISVAAIAMAAATPAAAQSDVRAYDIPAQDLAAALRQFAYTSGREVVASAAIVAGRRSGRVAGRYDAASALDRLLADTGLRVELVESAFVLREAGRPPGQDGDGAGEAIVVTGTRIRGAAPVGAPVTVIDREAMQRSGRGTVQSLLEALPSNFGGGPNEAVTGSTARNGAGLNENYGSGINLRGLGTESTLVLFDGNRPALAGSGGTFADVSLLPLLAIDRVEVLTDGASALYGSDAVAGVVNFRFRNRYKGVELSLRSATADGDFGEYELGGIAGTRWASGSVSVAYQYTSRGNLPGASRAFSTEDLRPYGGPDYRSAYTTPGTIIAANGAVFGIPGGQDGTALTAADLLPGRSGYRDARKEIDLLPAQDTHSVYASAEQRLGGGIELYARLLWARRDFAADRQAIAPTAIRVPTTNAFYVDPIGTHQPVTVRYDFGRDLGRQYTTGSTTGLSAVGGLTASRRSWRFDVNASYGAQTERLALHNIVNNVRLAAALASADRASAYNVFGDGGDTPAATIAQVRGSYDKRARFDVWTAAARADGPLLALPTGMLRLAAGYEHRDEALDVHTIIDVQRDGPYDTPIAGLPGSRNVDAVYGELLIPVSGEDARWLPGTLDLSLAGRSEWYDTLGRTTNPKVGLRWRPVAPLTLRGTWGTSFRAPGFRDLVGASDNLYAPVVLNDPQSPSGKSVALALFGYVPDLGPERATSWTAGVDLKDWPIEGLTLSATWFDIRYRDRIGTAETDYAQFLTRRDIYGGLVTERPDVTTVAALFADPGFVNLLGVTPADIDVIVDGRTRNLSTVTVRGLDFDLALRRPLGGGVATIGIGGTRLFAIDRQLTERAPATNSVSVLGNPVDLRLQGKALWSRGGFELAAFVNYTGSYVNQTVVPSEHVAAWTTVDAQIGYSWTRPGPFASARIALSATNLFDRDPPYVLNHAISSTLAYDPEQASPVGRLISLQLTIGL